MHSGRRPLLLVLAVVVGCGLVARPVDVRAVFVVSVEGSDATGTGAIDSPWASINHALEQVPDWSVIHVHPGVYRGPIQVWRRLAAGVVVSAQPPYQALLRHDETVIQFQPFPPPYIYITQEGVGVTFEGFDIAHDSTDATGPVIEIQDQLILPSDAGKTCRITLKNNIIHDSHGTHLVRIMPSAEAVVIEGNVFYNQGAQSAHVHVDSAANVRISDNVFFNDFAGSGRINGSDTGSYLVITDTTGGQDAFLGSQQIQIQRNILLHWEGDSAGFFVLVGGGGTEDHEALDVLVENNLLLGDAPSPLRAPFGVLGAADVTFLNNTVVGNLPAEAFTCVVDTVSATSPPNDTIRFYNNLWSDPTGSMGDLSDTPTAATSHLHVERNIYWNGGAPIPEDTTDAFNVDLDDLAVLGDPALRYRDDPVLPRWDEASGLFADGSAYIRLAHLRLAVLNGQPGEASVAIGAGSAQRSPEDDLVGSERPGAYGYTIGALESGAGTWQVQITSDAHLWASYGGPTSMELEARATFEPVSWTVIAGDLPTSFTLDATTGEVSGSTYNACPHATCAQGCTSWFTVQAVDSLNASTDIQEVTFDITPPICDGGIGWPLDAATRADAQSAGPNSGAGCSCSASGSGASPSRLIPLHLLLLVWIRKRGSLQEPPRLR